VSELPRLPGLPAGRLGSAQTDGAARTAMTGTRNYRAWMSPCWWRRSRPRGCGRTKKQA